MLFVLIDGAKIRSFFQFPRNFPIFFLVPNSCDLTMTELENVNGGVRVKSKGGETNPRKKTFEVRV